MLVFSFDKTIYSIRFMFYSAEWRELMTSADFKVEVEVAFSPGRGDDVIGTIVV